MKKIGLALGGGAVLGAAHIGVYKALEEHNISVEYITGTSVGAIVGSLIAFGVSYEKIYEYGKELRWFDISSLSLSKFALLSNKKISTLVTEMIGDKNIEDATIPLAIIATDIETGEKVVIKSGSVADAIMASTCIPGIFSPVEIEGRMLVDGGIVENVPMSPLSAMGAEYTIAVDLYTVHKGKKPKNILEVLINSFEFMMTNASSHYTKNANLLIKPDLGSFNAIDPKQYEALVKKGYEAAIDVLEKA